MLNCYMENNFMKVDYVFFVLNCITSDMLIFSVILSRIISTCYSRTVININSIHNFICERMHESNGVLWLV